MWAPSLMTASDCHLVENPFHTGCPIQMIVFCRTLTPKQYIGFTNHYLPEDFMAEYGLQTVISLLLNGIWTSPFGTLIQGPLSQSLTLVDTFHSGADCTFLLSECMQQMGSSGSPLGD